MEVFEAIDRRHSYRGPFKDQNVPRKDLAKIVQAGIQAPSGCNGQTTTFVIIDDPDLVSKTADIANLAAVPPAIIACIAEPRHVFQDMHFEVEDCSAAVENMLLAVTGLGYATVWIDGVLRMENRAEKLGALLGVPDDRDVRIILPIGVPEEEWEQREKLPFEERAWFNSYGS